MKINHKKEKIYSVTLSFVDGNLTFCLQAQNIEHLYNIIRQKLEDNLSQCTASVAILKGSDRVNSEASLKLNKLINKEEDE